MKQKPANFWHSLGPGLTTGAADDDPSGIATYSQAGARYGFSLLWLAPFTFPLMALVQEMCARIGLVTGRGLAANIRAHYSKKVLLLCTGLLLAANAFNIGADLGAMAKAVQLLIPAANFLLLIVGFTALCLALEIFVPYRQYTRYLKWLALVLLAYVLTGLMAPMDWREVLRHSVFPDLNFRREQIFLITGILGTTISPYLFFWQTSQEVEEEILEGKTTMKKRQDASPQAVRQMRLDVWSGMFVSNLVMFFIIAVCAAVLWQNGITDIRTAADAAAALRPLAGDAAYALFALGIIGTGLLALPVLAGSASYAIAESFRWREGLGRKFRQAHAFYGVVVLAMLLGMGLNFIGLDPIQALIYAAVLNGMIAPVVLVLIVRLSSSPHVMGENINTAHTTGWGWFIVVLMSLAAAAAIISLFL